MALEELRRALELSVAARDAALAGDIDRVQHLLDRRTPYLAADDVPGRDLESARAILIQIQRLDQGTTETLLDLRHELDLERAALRRAGRARAAYVARSPSSYLDRAG
jgi:hypothetical protein